MGASQCKALVLTCMDYRFPVAIAEHIEKLKLTDNCDRVSVAGGCLALSRPSDASGKDLLIWQIKFSQEQHGIRQVVLINHQRCKAYGEFDGEQSERVQHEADLKKAAQVIADTFGLKTACYFATIEEKGTERTIEFEQVS